VPGVPRLWSETRTAAGGYEQLDLAPDGKRFAVFPRPEAAPTGKGNVHVTMLLNFFDEVKRRIPAGK
jgi:serine/threonine-protein kinase